MPRQKYALIKVRDNVTQRHNFNLNIFEAIASYCDHRNFDSACESLQNTYPVCFYRVR